MTENARLILDVVNSSHDHPTAEQIYLRLKERNAKIAMATVYNNLARLYEQGHVRKLAAPGFPDRYDKATCHDHLICRKCGKLVDIALDDLTEQLREKTSVEVLAYDLKISYLCEQCKGALQSETA